ncbi:hypothetical protein GCM10009558_059120 [Virgisporangium aurantiacum]
MVRFNRIQPITPTPSTIHTRYGMPRCVRRFAARSWSKRTLDERPKRSRSATVKWRYSGWSWARKPIRLSARTLLVVGDSPNTSTDPDVGVSSPTDNRSSVVFPAPFGPTSAVTEPAGRSRVQSRRAQDRR